LAMVFVGFAAKAMVMARRKPEVELRLARATTFGVLIAVASSGALVATGMWFGPFEMFWCLLVWVLIARSIAKAGAT